MRAVATAGNGARSVMGRGGTFVCALIGMFMMTTAFGLGLSHRDLIATEVVGGVFVGWIVMVWAIPWNVLSRPALMLNPAVVIIGLGVLGALTTSAAQSFLGALTLCVAYLGMTQRPGTTLCALPFLLADWW